MIVLRNTLLLSRRRSVTKARSARDMNRGSFVITDFSMCFTCSRMSAEVKRSESFGGSSVLSSDFLASFNSTSAGFSFTFLGFFRSVMLGFSICSSFFINMGFVNLVYSKNIENLICFENHKSLWRGK
ncbi:hypothetical protein NP493_439g01018 [Ridgeia piscesae]|uniref:Uncharacterized protein n=1 Tax=Ridgeia piscesae TaxID=27915 RepID=A0AAD9KZG3_RIDPI|nr:hypothetical protein NP493_439g01018 [Ridgeia piscesae]